MDSPRLLVLPVAQGSKNERPPRGQRVWLSRSLPTLNSATCGGPSVCRIGAYARPASRGRSARSLWQRRDAEKPPIAFFTNDDIAPEIFSKVILRRRIVVSTPCPRFGCPRYDRSQLDKFARDRRLGPTGTPACHGLLVHTTLAITPERVPLGLLAQQVWARDPNDIANAHDASSCRSVRGESKVAPQSRCGLHCARLLSDVLLGQRW